MSGALPGGNRIWGWGIAVLILIGLLAGWNSRRAATPDGDPQMIVQASLETLKEQQVLTPFIARYIAVVPQTTTSAGSPQLLLVPGTVRYEVDVEGVRASDLEWNATTKELEIKLPKLRVNGPDIVHDAIARWRGRCRHRFLRAERACPRRASAQSRHGQCPARSPAISGALFRAPWWLHSIQGRRRARLRHRLHNAPCRG